MVMLRMATESSHLLLLLMVLFAQLSVRHQGLVVLLGCHSQDRLNRVHKLLVQTESVVLLQERFQDWVECLLRVEYLDQLRRLHLLGYLHQTDIHLLAVNPRRPLVLRHKIQLQLQRPLKVFLKTLLLLLFLRVPSLASPLGISLSICPTCLTTATPSTTAC